MNHNLKEVAIKAKLIGSGYNGFDRTELSPAEKRFAEMLVIDCAERIEGIYGGKELGMYLKFCYGIK